MKSITTIALALVLSAPIPAAALVGDNEEPVKKRRVVKVVTSDGVDIEEGEGFVVMGDDGEPIKVRSFFAFRGGYLGVQLVDLTPELRRHFGSPEDAGVMISSVSEDGPAAAAGIEVGDIISAVDGEEVKSGGELARLVRAGEEGDTVVLDVWRDGRAITLEATLAERERPQLDIGPMLWTQDEEGVREFEMRFEDLPENIIRLDEDHIHKALGALSEQLESPEWKVRVRSMVEEREGMEERIRELEARLRELEQRLSKLAN